MSCRAVSYNLKRKLASLIYVYRYVSPYMRLFRKQRNINYFSESEMQYTQLIAFGIMKPLSGGL